MGYDVERFVGHVNEGLLCCICRDVLKDPLQAPCEHAFCRSCIEGWLVNEVTCPEDRKALSASRLKPLFRYMKNDLDRLQIHCVNKSKGCTHVSKLEFLPKHEQECSYTTVKCPHERCSVVVPRRDLEKHLRVCEFQSRECSKGCGISITSADKYSHNCIAELRTIIDVLRAEYTGKLDEQKREMELRLNMQRGHMVQKEAAMQSKIDELKSEVSKLSQKVKVITDSELQRRQDMEKLEIEKKELIELLRGQRSSSVDRSRLPRPGTNTKKLPQSSDIKKLVHTSLTRNLVQTSDARNLVQTSLNRNLVHHSDARNLVQTADGLNSVQDSDARNLVQTANVRNLVQNSDARNLVPTPNVRKVVQTPDVSKLMQAINNARDRCNIHKILDTSYIEQFY